MGKSRTKGFDNILTVKILITICYCCSTKVVHGISTHMRCNRTNLNHWGCSRTNLNHWRCTRITLTLWGCNRCMCGWPCSSQINTCNWISSRCWLCWTIWSWYKCSWLSNMCLLCWCICFTKSRLKDWLHPWFLQTSTNKQIVKWSKHKWRNVVFLKKKINL